MDNIKILFAAVEVYPFAKTGGLADVACFLPKAIRNKGYDIRIIMPKYKNIREQYSNLLQPVCELDVEISDKKFRCKVEFTEYNGNIVYFIDNPYYFDRERIYDYDDEMERFVFYCKAVLEAIPLLGFKPQIIQCNDWETGFIPYYMRTHYGSIDYYKDIKTLLTIHTVLYQGVFSKQNAWDVLKTDWSYFTENSLDFYNQINFMKIGIMLADVINTVSPSYADQISTGLPFDVEPIVPVLNKRKKDLYGILNGIDADENNPGTDKRLYANFTYESLEGKAINKEMLQRELDLPVRNDVPIVAIISRLEITKGLYLIEKSFHEMLKDDLQFIVVGDGIPYYRYLFSEMMKAYPDKMRYLPYNESIAYKTYAASDIFLMPSYTEACGISQLIGMRYGAVPLVRETGGLKDTVKCYNEKTGEGNGFSFWYANQWVMLDAVRNAISYYHKKDIWMELVHRCMTQPLGWDKSSSEYIKLYKCIIDGTQYISG
ncbi:MAG: glycogen synthase [Clostridia bacterium]|nr:glycogen synthase [Clostridia bacterium]